ncbi:MAG: substrate-binding domain-containing protein [Paracoccaceae bacterium]
MRDVDALVINTFAADGSVAAVSEVVGAGSGDLRQHLPERRCARRDLFLPCHPQHRPRPEDRRSGGGVHQGQSRRDREDRHPELRHLPEACLPRKEGFLQGLTDAGVDFEVLADQTGFLADAALPISEAMLQANPTINILWAANEGGTTAHVLAVQGAGLADEVKVFGTDMSGQHAQFLKADNGILKAVTGQAPFQIGYDAVNLALDVIDGKEVEFDLIIPTILFARGDDASIDMFVETDGRAVFAE